MSAEQRRGAARGEASPSWLGVALVTLAGCASAPTTAGPVEVEVPSSEASAEPPSAREDDPSGAQAPTAAEDSDVVAGSAMAPLIRGTGELRDALGAKPPGEDEPGAEPAAGSSLDKEQIRAGVRAELAAIKQCYESRLVERPGLRGRVLVRFVIVPPGRVASAGIESSDLDDTDLHGCLLQVVRRMRFADPVRPAVVNYPFVFEPGA